MKKTRKEISAKYYQSHKSEINQRRDAYEKTPKGYLMRSYRNMLNRVLGINKKAAKNYFGLFVLPKDTFYSWSLTNPDFLQLWDSYISSGFERKLCPSIDRVNSSLGYSLDNLRWITQSQNSRLGSLQRWSANG
jgi:hypothetical protein